MVNTELDQPCPDCGFSEWEHGWWRSEQLVADSAVFMCQLRSKGLVSDTDAEGHIQLLTHARRVRT